MAQCVGGHTADVRILCCFLEHPQDVRIGPRQAAKLNGRAEQPVSIGRKLRYLFPCLQNMEQFGIDTHSFLRVDRLNVINMLPDD